MGRSRPWNPLIAGVFYRRGIIESWGRGTIKMAELTEQAGLPSPEFTCRCGEVVVCFRPSPQASPTHAGRELSPLQRELLEILGRLGTASLGEIRATLSADTARRTVQDNLQLLRGYGLVEPSGKGRGGRWALKKASS